MGGREREEYVVGEERWGVTTTARWGEKSGGGDQQQQRV